MTFSPSWKRNCAANTVWATCWMCLFIGSFRKIQFTANQKGLTVQARDRYWAHH